MSCRKKCHGRFAPIQFESDNCRKGKEYVPIWKKEFNAPCFDICKDGVKKEVVFKKPCGNPCDPAMPCQDCTCKKNMKVASWVPGCGKSCMFSSPCHAIGCKADLCESIQPCGSKLSSPALGFGPCSSPCSPLKPCHDIKNVVFRRIRTDCRGMQPWGQECIGRFPFFTVKPDGDCCKRDHEDFCFN